MLSVIAKLPNSLKFILLLSAIALTWKFFFIVIGILAAILITKSETTKSIRFALFSAFILISILANHYIWPEINPLYVQDDWNKTPEQRSILGSQDNAIVGFVTNVVDGDTIKVDIDGNTETIRLIGIDTPETKHPQKDVECFGQEASAYLTNRILNKQVSLTTDVSQDSIDSYGRSLYYVWLGEELINLEMVREGYAYEYTYDVPYEFQYDFRQAETVASEQGYGLWSANTCSGKRVEDSAVDPTPTLSINETEINTQCFCSENLYDCDNFSSQKSAQQCFESCGGSNNDIHRLDGNNDGIVCTNLP